MVLHTSYHPLRTLHAASTTPHIFLLRRSKTRCSRSVSHAPPCLISTALPSRVGHLITRNIYDTSPLAVTDSVCVCRCLTFPPTIQRPPLLHRQRPLHHSNNKHLTASPRSAARWRHRRNELPHLCPASNAHHAESLLARNAAQRIADSLSLCFTSGPRGS